MESDNYLFVYGTLMKATGNKMYRLLAGNSDFLDDGYFQGKLYLVDYYPGVIDSTSPEDIVKGEIYLLKKPNETLNKLDLYEECGPSFDQPTEYIREKRDITLKSGKTLKAWVYIYNYPVQGLKLLKSGDFLNKSDLQ